MEWLVGVVGWLVGWLVRVCGWMELDGWLVGWLVGWMDGWMDVMDVMDGCLLG